MPNGFGGRRGIGRGFGLGMGRGFGRGFGFGMGRGFGRGMGFGFRGSSPPWPYIGLGRGGLPRCGYFFSGAAGVQPEWSYQQFPYTADPGFSAGQNPYSYPAGVPPAPGTMPFAPQVTPEQELDFLENQAEAIKGQLEQIDARMRDLESEK